MYERDKYQFFSFHALHHSLEEVDGVTLAEVEGLLDGCDDVNLHSIRKTAGRRHRTRRVTVTRLEDIYIFNFESYTKCFLSHYEKRDAKGSNKLHLDSCVYAE